MPTSVRGLAQRSPLGFFLAALLVMGAIGWLDYVSGTTLSFALFYLVPVSVVSSFSGRSWGISAAVVCTMVGLIADLSQDAAIFSASWNAVTRLGVFAVVSVVLAQLRVAHDREHMLARTDPLTGVANYRSFEEAAQREMYASRRYGGPLSLAYLDLDGFKEVNDRRGHSAGDAVLRVVATTLVRCLRPTDVVARIGGDEFVVLLPRTSVDAARVAVDRVREELAGLPATHDVGVSAGIVELHQKVGSIDDLLSLADERMYADKAARKAVPADDVAALQA